MSQSERYTAWTHRGGVQAFWTAGLLALLLPAGWYASGRPLPFSLFWLVPIGAFAGYGIGKTIGWAVLGASGLAAQSFIASPTAGRFASEHSEIMTLEARGDFRRALAAWEALAVAEPGNPWPLVRSAELCARELGDPQLAIERFRMAHDLPGTKPELKRYASQQIIDLLLGPLDDRRRAIVELRKLIDAYPESREAEGAREALRSLKAGP